MTPTVMSGPWSLHVHYDGPHSELGIRQCTARMVEMNRLAGLHNPGQTACTLYTGRSVSWPHYSRRHITRAPCPRCPDAGARVILLRLYMSQLSPGRELRSWGWPSLATRTQAARARQLTRRRAQARVSVTLCQSLSARHPGHKWPSCDPATERRSAQRES